MKKNIKLYQVFCGLFADDSTFPPYANINNDWQPSKKKAIEIYDSITGNSFNQKEVIEARGLGHKTYNRCITVCEMTLSLYNRALEVDARAKKPIGEPTLNHYVWTDGVKWDIANLRDEDFTLTGRSGKMKMTATVNYLK